MKKLNVGGAGDGLFYNEKLKTWGFRVVKDGKDIRRKGFKSKTEAKQARIQFLATYEEQEQVKNTGSYTFGFVYEHYKEHGAAEKRENTLKKQESMWRCHIKEQFENLKINETPPGFINNYLTKLYTQGDGFNDRDGAYSFQFVNGFLKFFYLLYGYSYRMGWIDKKKYDSMCEDEHTRIQMPKAQDGDEEENTIETYTLEEIEKMRERIKNSSLYIAFECGYYLGLRISETFGLMWEDVDFTNKTITIRRQMLKSGHSFVLVPCKTTTAKRVIDIPDKLYALLVEHKAKQESYKKEYGTAYKNTETVRVRMRAGQDDSLVGGSFINRREDGSLLSSDSFKSWAKNFKNDLGIHFKYHNLRHTHASTLAALNVPIPKLMERLGHKKISTTQKYYFGNNEIADAKMKQYINQI